MGFLAAAIPIASAVIGAMGQSQQQQQPQPAAPPPPGLGEIFAANEANFAHNNQQNNQFAALMGPGFRGPYG